MNAQRLHRRTKELKEKARAEEGKPKPHRPNAGRGSKHYALQGTKK